MIADVVFFNGNIITLSEEHQVTSALAVKDSIILAVGPFEDMKIHLGRNTKSIDLKGKTVVPGFIDSHIHLISLGLDMQVLDLTEVTSKLGLLEKLAKAQNTPKGNWIKGYGFEEELVDELPMKWELDSLYPDNPVYLESKNYKLCISNSLALKKLTKTQLEGVIVEKTPNDELTGIIRVKDETLLYNTIDVPTLDPVDNYLRESELELAIEIASKKVVKAGITSIHDPQLPPNALRAFKKAVREGKTPLRMYLGCDRNKEIELEDYFTEGLGSEPYRRNLKMGMVKLFADDRMSKKEFKKRVREAHRAGLQLSIHATNIQEMENAFDALEKALEEAPTDNHRHRIEHADNLNEKLLGRAAKLGLIIAAQPEIVYKLEPRYPEGVMKVAYSSMIRAGINVSGGSDSPTVPIKRRARPPLAYPTPLIGIGFAVSRKTRQGMLIDKEENISVLEALKVYTINGAYASFEESLKGTLEVGKLADLAVLSDNPFKVNTEDIGKIKVEMTIIGGEIVD